MHHTTKNLMNNERCTESTINTVLSAHVISNVRCQKEENKKWVEMGEKNNLKVQKLTPMGFEPTPMKTTALTLRLRPLGHSVIC
jgi:hypothetical protein